ncbi:MAG: hypothetical protein K2G55_06340 [Lachnospiraceae bacterium]|nr:hypothetical protein [Lachnospiraceae bacterium]MDE7204422.1 hypothetical protein [Lachnospiraceae bacterium]
MGQEQLYERLLAEVKRTGNLCLEQRKKLWKCFEHKAALGDMDAREKEIRLALVALAKTTSMEYINNPLDDIESLKRKAEERYELVRKEMEGSDDFYIIHMMQAFRSFLMMIEGDPDEGNGGDSANELDDGDLEVEELDTSYCACVLWTYMFIT